MPSATYTVDQNVCNSKFNNNKIHQKHEFAEEIELPSIIVSASIHSGLSNSTLNLNNRSTVKPECKSVSDVKFGLLHIFRYADIWDALLMIVGIVMSLATGASLPILAMFFGEMTNTFIRQTKALNSITATTPDYSAHPTVNETITQFDSIPPLTPEEFDRYMTQFSLYYLYIGIVVLLSAYTQTWCWEMACERQVYRLRNVFFSQIVRQDITWFDTNQSSDLTSKLFDDLERIREGISSKFSMLTQYVSTFISGLLVGFYISPKLTGLLLLVGPIIIGIMGFLSLNASRACHREQIKYAEAGSIAEEVFTSIRTVAAFGLEKQGISQYVAALRKGRNIATNRYRVFSVGLGTVFMLMYIGYGVAFYYGANLVSIGEATPGTVFTVFFSVMAGSFSIGSAIPYLNSVSTAIGVARNLYGIIDRVPKIDSYSKKGLKPIKVTGRIEIRNVDFRYPSRPEVKVLNNLNFTIRPGQTVALVGSSGAGKSTIVGLLLRFYDPEAGQIYLDSIKLTDLNVHWLRDQIGVVSQEPILFGVSIADNIRYGREDITNDELVEAAIQANAYDFIKELPNGFDTYVGDRGCQLSGGQKQRISIARALVRNPKILLLDEATSALDSQSEGIVQDALDRVMEGRTTIIVAHRLSTIKNADVIHAMKNGKIYESGTHTELMNKKGLYYNLVVAQINLCDEDKEETVLEGKEDKTEDYENCEEALEDCVMYEDDDFKEIKNNSKYCMWKLMKFNSPEWAYLLFGCIGCTINGGLVPIYAYFYGQVFESLTLKGEALNREARFWSFMFVVLGIVSGLTIVCQTWLLTFASEKLMMRLRAMAFTNILRQSVGWFDNKDSSPGCLTTKLARDAPIVKAAGGMRAGQVMSSIVTLTIAICIALFYGWKLAIVLGISVPLIVGAGYQQQMGLRKNQRRDAKFMDEAGRIATESVQNVRTVQSLGKEEKFVELYHKSLKVPNKEAKKQAYIYAALFALSQSITYFLYAVAFKYGSYLVLQGEMSPSAVYRVFFALSFSAHSVGHTMAFLQDYSKAKQSASLIFQLIEKPTEIDSQSNDGDKPEIIGKISFKGVSFSYPTRKTKKILNNMDFTVEPGKTLALVGESGCGKSTVISLLERFYNPSLGVIEIDGCDIRKINIRHLRNNIGLVTQEPVLFDCSIRENISYGVSCSDVPFDAIVEAAKKANAHNFIMCLPQGYDTIAGDRGTQLSGGQKQRVAIARALVRNPKILLLDEATSALDTESEKIVQEALDEARKGRTCITIAHRLSTIQSADDIAVVWRGQITELGSHEELQELKGCYYELVKRQQM
ncbi:multidrug resistance protein 1A isoform X2 [Acyrthosiphon pisum]|uniref:ABC-type xenobiotic transporter n=1 Tax=Acyrthosiphon pisum TaxID=7029 RepID=A0A8R1X040_ACYPI|nr:multidrug resistance protein 1A isoform X2 [Acyrthosiphon pisum]|eukprot:XP_008178172.1 PREDICTED: multidrug resistance protein 1A isoform X2 [Acyrthosiphon pisum]